MQLLNTLNNPEWLQYLWSGIVGALVYTSLIPDGRNELRWFLVVYILPFALAGFGIASILPTSETSSWWPASLNHWIAAILSSVLLPVVLASLKNNDLPHKWLRKWSLTRQHQYPSALVNVFNDERVDYKRKITLVLKRDGCYVTGNSYEYPENDSGQFVLINVRWNCDCCTGKTASVIIVGMSDVATVMLDYQTKPES